MHKDFDLRDLEPLPASDPPKRRFSFSGLRLPRLPARVGPIGIAATAVVGFGAIVFWALGGSGGKNPDGQPQIIKADEQPIRRRPEDTGGLHVPHQDRMVMHQGAPAAGGQVVERLGALPEAPVSRAGLPPAPTAATQPPPVAAPASVTTQPPPARPVSTQGAAPAQGTPTQTAQLQAPPPAARPLASPLATPQPAPAAPPATTVAAATGVRVQLAAVRSQDAANAEWQRLVRANPELAALKMSAVPVTVEGKGTFWRVQAGPIGGNEAAQRLCQALKSRNQGCIVVRS
jgi:hypothetical protein